MNPKRKKSVALTQYDPHMKPKKAGRKAKTSSTVAASFVLSWKFWAWTLCVFTALLLLSYALRN